MDDDTTLVEIREGTGLSLGVFDLLEVRQRIYVGEFGTRCQWRVGEGEWSPISAHPGFAEVLWVTGQQEAPKDDVKRVSRFGGWQDQAGKGAGGQAPPPAAVAPAPSGSSGGGLLGRLFGKKG